MMKRIVIAAAFVLAGFVVAKVDDHVRPTMWGWVWDLTPTPNWPNGVPGVKPMSQLVQCPNGDLTLPPWHVYVLWDSGAPITKFPQLFLQERGS
jgi:hypothetical protein